MKCSSIPQTFTLFFIMSFLFLFPSVSFAQTGGTSSLEASPQIEAFDNHALEKLNKMSSGELDQLDKKLAEALTFFYDREYAKALPIFRDISYVIETTDILYWYGSCAAGAGQPELAVEKFEKILRIEPNLPRIRVELAAAYFQQGKYEEAQQELEKVLEAKPPEPVKVRAERLLSAIHKKTRKLSTHFRLSLGIQRDSNVNAGPEDSLIVVPQGLGTIGPLSERQLALHDWVVVGNLAGNALYDIGKTKAWMWNTAAHFYQTHNQDYHEFDYTRWSLESGPWWLGAKSVLKVPLGYAGHIYEHDPLYDSFYLSPSYEYFFTPGFSLRGRFAYVRNTYEYSSLASKDRTDEDNINRVWEINPNFYFNNRNDLLSFFVSDENLNAKILRWTYDAENFAVSYLKQLGAFGWDLELYLRYKFTKKEYAAAIPGWPPTQPREDKRHNLYAALTRNFHRRYFASFYYNFINNHSNTDLYEYRKKIYGFRVGVRF